MRGDSLGKVYSGNPQEEAACRVLSQKAALASSVLSSRTTLQGAARMLCLWQFPLLVIMHASTLGHEVAPEVSSYERVIHP